MHWGAHLHTPGRLRPLPEFTECLLIPSRVVPEEFMSWGADGHTRGHGVRCRVVPGEGAMQPLVPIV